MSTKPPYSDEGKTITYLGLDDYRKRAFDGGNYNDYWLRTPAVHSYYTYYVYKVLANGKTDAIGTPSNELGVLIEISF